MTDVDVWHEIALWIENTGTLPDGRLGPTGLCPVLTEFFYDNLIKLDQKERLQDQLTARFGNGRRYGPDKAHYFPVRNMKARAAACRELMRECMERA